MKEKISSSQKALNVWAVILIMWSVYRANFGVSLPIWLDEFIIKPLFFVCPVIWYTVKMERKDFFKRINLHLKSVRSDLALGILFGIVFFLAGGISSQYKTGSFLAGLRQLIRPSALPLLGVSFATAFSEEVLSRGFVFTHLYEESKNLLSAVFISSVLFFVLHIPILFTSQNLSGPMLLQVMTTDIALSIIIAILYFKKKSLLLPIIIHAFYSFSLNFFL